MNNGLTAQRSRRAASPSREDGRSKQHICTTSTTTQVSTAASVSTPHRAFVVDDITIVTGFEGTTGSSTTTSTSPAGPAPSRSPSACSMRTVGRWPRGRAPWVVWRIADVILWEPGKGYLYQPGGGGARRRWQLSTATRQPFGVRTVEVRGMRFLINGEPFYFTGFGMHEDHSASARATATPTWSTTSNCSTGWAPTPSAPSHYPYADEVMDFADRHGIVVIDETAAVGLNLRRSAACSAKGAKTTYADDFVDDAPRPATAGHLGADRPRQEPPVSRACGRIANEPDAIEEGARELLRAAGRADPQAGPDPARRLRQRRLARRTRISSPTCSTSSAQPLLRLVPRHRGPRQRRVGTGEGAARVGAHVRQTDHHDRVRCRHDARAALHL